MIDDDMRATALKVAEAIAPFFPPDGGGMRFSNGTHEMHGERIIESSRVIIKTLPVRDVPTLIVCGFPTRQAGDQGRDAFYCEIEPGADAGILVADAIEKIRTRDQQWLAA